MLLSLDNRFSVDVHFDLESKLSPVTTRYLLLSDGTEIIATDISLPAEIIELKT